MNSPHSNIQLNLIFSINKYYCFIFLLTFITSIIEVQGHKKDNKVNHPTFFDQEIEDFPPRPTPQRLVNDFANVLSTQEINLLEQTLSQYANNTSTQIVIVSIPTIGMNEIAQYAVDLALNWGIGTKGKDNGLLILFALKERKVTIQTGYGLEEKIPDIEAARIIRSILQPHFKNGNYFEGLKLTTERVFGLLKGEFVNQNPKKANKRRSFSFVTFIMIFVIFIIISRLFRKKGNGNNNNRGGGGFFPIFFPFGGGGGYYSSGGYSSTGSDFGGFGGFGGGDFGGGGASGDW